MEIWKSIKGYEDIYEVSNYGNVKSFKTGSGFILKPTLDTNGYLSVSLRVNRFRKTKQVHQLVAIAFLNHKPNGWKLVVDHINNDRLDNRLNNLQIITQRENSSKDRVNGTSKYVGVCWQTRDKKWRAKIQVKGKLISLGHFNKEIDAHNAYQNKLNSIK